MVPPKPATSAAPDASRLDRAIRQLEKAVSAHPGDAKTRYNLALLLIERGRRDAARRHLDEAIRTSPQFAPPFFTRGRLALDDGDLALAERLLRAASTAPAIALDASFVLAEVLRRLERKEESAKVLKWVIAQNPPSYAPFDNLFQLRIDDAPGQALATAERGLARFPQSSRLYTLKGFAQIRTNDPEGAVVSLRHALELDPTDVNATGLLLQAVREAALWEDEDSAFGKARAVLRKGVRRGAEMMLALHAGLNFPFTGAELRKLAEESAVYHSRNVVPLPPIHAAGAARPLVVGYLSPDYRDHAIAHLVADLFTAHDTARVRAVAFSLGPDDGDPVRRDIAAAAHPFVDLRGLSDRAGAERIRAEGTDILVDLAIYTHHHRPAIAAHRPAPVQVAWLGLPATSGAPWIDYLLVDDIVAPPEHADRFTETLAYLPCGYQPNRRLGHLTPPPDRAALGLPEDGVVFGCFNSHRKIDRESFATWLAVLKQVPGSTLWLLAPPDAVAARYRAVAAAEGVAPERLTFAPTARRAAHLARLQQADLMLDTLIYGAHTTCSDALRAGVPMLTVRGERFAARVGASLLTRAGLPELVHENPRDMIATAVRLGTDAAARAALRRKLAASVAASPVFDPDAQARALEDAFEAMWAKRS